MSKVAKFFIQDADVPLQVRDDYGRNPMHDACWNAQPNFEVVDMILDICPDLLYIKDRRGFTPLAYARKEDWGKWKSYFSKKSPQMLAPRLIQLMKQSSTAC
jgi:hypothetical protein